ncbi:MAG: histidine kinase [Bacteroidota bacterium]
MFFLRQQLASKQFKNAYSLTLLLITAAVALVSLMTNSVTDISGLIYWPIAYFLILWTLGFFIPGAFLSALSLDFTRGLIWHFGFSCLFGLSHMLLTDISIVLLERFLSVPEHYTLTDLPVKWYDRWYNFFHGLVWYWVGMILLFVIYFREMYQYEKAKNEDLIESLSEAQVKTLSTELNPHFLFNAMNGIAMQIRKGDNEEAVGGIASLGEMLRAVLSTRNEVLITVRDELALVEEYISLEKKRFRDRVSVEMHCKKDLYTYKMPKFLLQPVVENAFKHGISGKIDAAKIVLKLFEQGNRLVMQVFNSGENTKNWTGMYGRGLGLPNTVERLRRIYQSDYSFHMKQQQNGFLVEIAIPKVT